MYRLYELRRRAVSLILPNRCPFCDGVIGIGEYWCEDCYGRLSFVDKQPEPPHDTDMLLCCCYYGGRARSAILRMKDGGYAYSYEAFAVMMTELVGELMAEIDFVAAVPTSRRRKRELGYAQAEKLAQDIARRGRKPFRRVLGASAEKKEQKHLNKEERLENARKSYKIVDKEYICGKNILLVDDVCTTGATIAAISKLLKEAGAKAVYAIAFAKTR